MASIRTHNNRRRSKARSPRQRQRDMLSDYVRRYRRMYPRMKKWMNSLRGGFEGGTVTGRIPRDPEPQYILPRHGLNLREAVMPMGLMIDYSDVERRVLAHTIRSAATAPGAIIVDAPYEAEILNTVNNKQNIYDRLAEQLKMPRRDVKENLMGVIYGLPPEKAAERKAKKNG